MEEEKDKIGIRILKYVGMFVVAALIIWAGRHILFTSVDEQNELANQPAWMQHLPDWVRFMILDVQRLF